VSSEGFRLSLDGTLAAQPGDQGRLQTTDGRHIVRLVHVQRGSQRIEVGLLRLRDLPFQVAAGESLSPLKGRRRGWRLPRPSIAGLLQAVVPIVFGGVLLWATVGRAGLVAFSRHIAGLIGL
jgi:hypothetical protein